MRHIANIFVLSAVWDLVGNDQWLFTLTSAFFHNTVSIQYTSAFSRDNGREKRKKHVQLHTGLQATVLSATALGMFVVTCQAVLHANHHSGDIPTYHQTNRLWVYCANRVASIYQLR